MPIGLVQLWSKCRARKVNTVRPEKQFFANDPGYNLYQGLKQIQCTYSIPEIIFSYSSHQGTWFSFFALSISCIFFS